MIIDASCGKLLNSREVYIHDDILNEFCFDRREKKLHLSIFKKGESADRISINFLNVIAFEMTSCDFWGSSPYILDFEYVEQKNSTLIPKLFERTDSNNYPLCSLGDLEKYIETIITFKSGDKLIVACEYIII